MILSPRPWHLVLWPNSFTSVKDATGKTIAMFANYEDAEWLLSQTNATTRRGVQVKTIQGSGYYHETR